MRAEDWVQTSSNTAAFFYQRRPTLDPYAMRPFVYLSLLFWFARSVGMEEEGDNLLDFPNLTLPTKLPPVPLFAPPLYFPDHAIPFSAQERSKKLHKLNHRTSLLSRISHPIDAVLEYPETTDSRDKKIAHIFSVDPLSFRAPKSNIQYSLDVDGADSREYLCKQLPHPTSPKTWASGRTESLTCESPL